MYLILRGEKVAQLNGRSGHLVSWQCLFWLVNNPAFVRYVN